MSETIQTTQNPPKRVDEIMTEINQFDPTILTSPSFQFGAPNIQPEEIKTTINNHRNYQESSETGQVSKYIITSHLSKIDDYNFIWEKTEIFTKMFFFPSKSLLAIGLLSNVIALGLVIAPSYMHNNECEVLEVNSIKFTLA